MRPHRKAGVLVRPAPRSFNSGGVLSQAAPCLRSRQPHYLDCTGRKNGRLVADWNVVVPRDMLERSWEEAP